MPGRRLGLDEREVISRGLAAGDSYARIAAVLGRPTSTVSREVGRCGGRRAYRATRAQRTAGVRGCRPKVRRLVADPLLALVVSDRLAQRWSPQQIAARLRVDYVGRPHWQVSHETIYQRCTCKAAAGSVRS